MEDESDWRDSIMSVRNDDVFPSFYQQFRTLYIFVKNYLYSVNIFFIIPVSKYKFNIALKKSLRIFDTSYQIQTSNNVSAYIYNKVYISQDIVWCLNFRSIILNITLNVVLMEWKFNGISTLIFFIKKRLY